MGLDTNARTKGFEGMKAKMEQDPAARVRRQLKAGRRRTTNSLDLNSFAALGRIVDEADRGRKLMGEAGLDPNDVRLGLIIRTGTNLLCKPLPAPEHTGPFFEAVSRMADVQFLGILWEQTDRGAEAKGLPGFVSWITPFSAKPEDQEQLNALQAFIMASGTRMSN